MAWWDSPFSWYASSTLQSCCNFFLCSASSALWPPGGGGKGAPSFQLGGDGLPKVVFFVSGFGYPRRYQTGRGYNLQGDELAIWGSSVRGGDWSGSGSAFAVLFVPNSEIPVSLCALWTPGLNLCYVFPTHSKKISIWSGIPLGVVYLFSGTRAKGNIGRRGTDLLPALRGFYSDNLSLSLVGSCRCHMRWFPCSLPSQLSWWLGTSAAGGKTVRVAVKAWKQTPKGPLHVMQTRSPVYNKPSPDRTQSQFSGPVIFQMFFLSIRMLGYLCMLLYLEIPFGTYGTQSYRSFRWMFGGLWGFLIRRLFQEGRTLQGTLMRFYIFQLCEFFLTHSHFGFQVCKFFEKTAMLVWYLQQVLKLGDVALVLPIPLSYNTTNRQKELWSVLDFCSFFSLPPQSHYFSLSLCDGFRMNTRLRKHRIQNL